MRNQGKAETTGLVLIVLIVLFAISLFFLVPWYRTWTATMSGTASLNRAEQEKKIMIETAKAEVEAAKLQAEAIRIVGQAAQDFPEYREQQFIQMFGEAIQDGDVKLIFVPTEGNIPIIMNPDIRK